MKQLSQSIFIVLLIFSNSIFAATEKSIYCPKPSELNEWIGAYGFPFAYWGVNFQGKKFGNKEYFYGERFDIKYAQLNLEKTNYVSKKLSCIYDSRVSSDFQQHSIVIMNQNDY